jgi:uncharacterized protein YijF (DUF1287 family)
MRNKKIIIPLAVFLMGGIISFLGVYKYDRSRLNNLSRIITSKKTYPINDGINNVIYKTAIEFANSVSWVYDPKYYNIPCPNGDVPSGGACTDVVIRVLRKNNLDLQKLIHEDMTSNFSAYPKNWGLNNPDPNIDHRRVPNIMKYFERQGYSLTLTNDATDYKPGDIVTWTLSPGITHIGIVLENQDVFHNMGPTSRIDRDFLFSHKIIGHYRIENT